MTSSANTTNEQLRAAWARFLGRLKPEYAVTFNFGPWIRPGFGHYAMKGFAGRIERKALGRDYCHLRKGRLVIAGFFEHADTNPHWHCVVRAPGSLADILQTSGSEVWDQLVPAGQFDFGPIRDMERVKSYFTKEAWKESRLDQAFLYCRDSRRKLQR